MNDLDTVPLDKDELVSDVVFGNEPLAYEQSLAKIYAGMAIGGNSGGDSDQDVVGIDGGSQASFLRVLWNMQDLPSDIAHCAWNDPGIPEFNHISWGAHVADRKGHDMRYAIDPTKIHNELGWLPETKFEDGIKKTIKWYLENKEWWETIISGEYQNYYEKMYAHREEI